jgi:hypothetical protein
MRREQVASVVGIAIIAFGFVAALIVEVIAAIHGDPWLFLGGILLAVLAWPLAHLISRVIEWQL